MKAIIVAQHGGPEVLQLQERELPPPGEGQVRIRIHAAGVNFVDVYQRSGRYPVPTPYTPGSEGAGVIEELGPGVSEMKVGDRVAYAMEPGAYAESANVQAWRLVRIPDGLDLTQAAAALLQGMTARFLTSQTYPIQKGDTVLVHAAAGGVGLWLCQLAKERGARVLGTAGTEEKAALARAHGADEVILYRTVDFAAEVKRLTGGAGCHAVYDGVGQATFEGSLDSLRPRGMMVLFGAASGPVPPFDPQVLNRKGSLFLTRPSLHHYAHDRDSVRALGTPVLEGLAAGRYTLRLDRSLPLAEAAQAHRLLESRQTAGKLVLTPG